MTLMPDFQPCTCTNFRWAISNFFLFFSFLPDYLKFISNLNIYFSLHWPKVLWQNRIRAWCSLWSQRNRITSMRWPESIWTNRFTLIGHIYRKRRSCKSSLPPKSLTVLLVMLRLRTIQTISNLALTPWRPGYSFLIFDNVQNFLFFSYNSFFFSRFIPFPLSLKDMTMPVSKLVK